MFLASCTATQFITHTAKRVVKIQKEKPSKGTYKIGDPYKIKGVWYRPKADYRYSETGIASWYGPKFHGRRTANGETFNMNDLTAAHRTLPMPSYVRVTNLTNGRSLVLKVNDRGPFANSRIIDISRRGAQLLGFLNQGTARVRVRILARESRALAAQMRGGMTLTAANSPIKVGSLPKPMVSSQTLPPPKGAGVAPPPPPVNSPKKVDAAAPVESIALPEPGKVTQVAVGPTNIFIQAGAFSIFENANRVRAKLNRLGGQVKVTSVLINGMDLFRVRVGPLASVEDADRMLEKVIRTGFVESRIIID
ncbi:MAG: septal ring lytic transglycosylase RlpA family protein [Rhodospirillales bacterium]